MLIWGISAAPGLCTMLGESVNLRLRGRQSENMGRAFVTTVVGILFALAATLAVAQSRASAPSPVGPSSEWAKGNRVLLGVTQERLGFSAQWRFQRSASGDILL